MPEAGLTPTAFVKRGVLAEPFVWDYATRLRRYRPLLVADGFGGPVEWPDPRVELGGVARGSRVGGRVARVLAGEERFPFDLPQGRAQRHFRSLVSSRGGPEVVHAHYGPTGVWCLQALGRRRPPLVTTFYCYDLFGEGKYPAWQRAYRRLFEESELTLVLSDYIREFVLELGCPEEKVEVDRLGVDLETFAYREPEPTDAPVVLSVSNYQPKKGLVYLARAFAEIAERHPKARLRLVGAGRDEARVARELERAGVLDRTELLGPVAYADLAAVYRAADVFVLPSVMSTDFDLDEISMVIVQAMAVGLPVVTTHHAGIPEVVRDWENGVLAEERSTASLAAGLDRLLGSPGEWSRLATAARRTVEELFDIEEHVRALEARYDRLRAA